MNDIEIFIQNNFRIRYCDKYKGVSFEKCECGRNRIWHSEIPTVEEEWSYENNTKLRKCDVFGNINFTGYDNVVNDHKPKFIRFNCENEPKIEEAVFRLITSYWHFPRPQLIISVNGGYKRMLFKNEQQKKVFKQGLIEVMKKGTTWIIGGGFNVGIHKLVSEAVYEYRLYNEVEDNNIKLIGISTWGVVQNNDSLTNKLDNNNNHTVSYAHGFATESGKVTLDAHYDCFLFCDDGTEKKYGKETNFQLKFEEYVRKEADTFSVQILYEGGRSAIENSYLSLQKLVPLVVIKESGRAANIIADLLEFPKRTCKEDIISILEENNQALKIPKMEMVKFQKYLYDIYDVYKKYIVIHDTGNKSIKFDKTILEAIISSREEKDLEKLLNLTIQFDCYDIAETKVFQHQRFSELGADVLRKNFMKVLENNRPRFVQLFLENNFDIEDFLNEQVLLQLYENSISNRNCHCADLLFDRILTYDKSFGLNQESGKLLNIIYKIIRQLTGNILDKVNYSRNICENILITNHNTSYNDSGRIYRTVFYQPKKPNLMTSRELFIWALLSGYMDMALIFWKIGKDHIGSALIGSIILNKMVNIIVERGYSDISDKLNEASTTFQQMAIDVVNEAYMKNQGNTYILLIRALKQWNNMTCLQIAISGDLLDFLHISACRSYTRKAWMGELNTFQPLWKIVLNIPLGLVLIPVLILPSNSHEKNRRSPDILMNSPESNLHRRKSNVPQNVTYRDGIIKFYQAPIVKFVVHLVSYIFFLSIFAYLNLVELEYLDNLIAIKNNPAEIFVYLCLFGILIEEIRQAVDQERTGGFHKLKSYFNGFWNAYDVSVILLFLVTIALRILISKEGFLVTRCFYAVTLSMFCIRAMQFYFISRSIGPKVVMIRKMIVDILFFLSIFTLFLISYGTLFQSLYHPNEPLNFTRIVNVFHNPYFQTYGELLLDTFDSKYCNSTSCAFRDMTVKFGFAIFLLFTNILLINLLIAMFGHTFKMIQGDSEKFFSFIQIQLVEEFHEKPLLPPPLNILYYFVVMFFRFSDLICNKEKKLQNTFLVRHLPPEENIKICGFEQLCMESSVLNSQYPINAKTTTDYLSETICVEKSFDKQDTSYSMKSNRQTYSRIEKLEEQLDNMIKSH